MKITYAALIARMERKMSTTGQSGYVTAKGLRLFYREYGAGPPVLLLHGWPTSSLLWRNVAPRIAQTRRVIAIDLPGFGGSDKPVDVKYDFAFFESVLNDALQQLGIKRVALVVHDLGGPVGLYWAVRNPERVEKLVILNTLVYPEIHWAPLLFLIGLNIPLYRRVFSTNAFISLTLFLGMQRKDRLTRELRAAYHAPFQAPGARRAMVKTWGDMGRDGFKTISAGLSTLTAPVRVIYGAKDPVLHDVAGTARRLQKDFPRAKITALDHCGHFLQEDDPETLSRLLEDFFSN
jgi:pimeloyl-ACP methyl ester carboxylesterase